MRKIIGISGWKGSGKDTIANYLQQNYSWVIVSIADRLKQTLSFELDIPLDNFIEVVLKSMQDNKDELGLS